MISKGSEKPVISQSGDRVPGWTPEIGIRIALIIERFGGLKAAAEFLNTKAETVASWRDGKTRAPLFSIQALSEKAGFTLDWLVSGSETAARPNGVARSKCTQMDTEFMGQIAEMVEQAYRELGSRPSARELGQVSARIYVKAISVGPDPSERLGALKVLVNDAREDLLRKMSNLE